MSGIKRKDAEQLIPVMQSLVIACWALFDKVRLATTAKTLQQFNDRMHD